MLLLLDLGNTSLNIGVCQDRSVIYSFRTYSDKLKSESEYQELLCQFLNYHSLKADAFCGAILSSVVPSLTKRLQQATAGAIQKECLTVSKSLRSGLAIRMDNPAEVGSDLICDALGAVDDYKTDCLIIDLGTAIKFILVSADKQYLGGAIAPGIRLSSDTLWNNAAMLTDIELEAPKHYIGKNSKDSMNSGIILGCSQMIKGMADSFQNEYGKPIKKIITGGDADLVKDTLGPDYTYNPVLLFEGLYDIFLKNQERQD
jgi:type III pantothenate kinase